jgi:transglutaminase-like putative cysteine protease
MKNILVLLLLSQALGCFAAEIKYPVSEIPEEMKQGMYAVIRDRQVRYDIQSKSSTLYYRREVITILNGKAKQYAQISAWYDKLRSIKTFKATVYDAFGREIKKLKNSDIKDESEFDGFSLLSDNRSKSADLSQAVYPYTIEFEVETQSKYLYSAPDFFVYRDDEVSIQKSSYEVVFPAELKPRYKLFNVSEPGTAKAADGREFFLWTFTNVIPTKFERHTTDFERTVGNIKISPVEFEFAGYPGKMNSWKDYGLWQASLNKGRDVLPEATRQKVKDLVKHTKTDDEKIKILYEYMQNKTRYVSIQLGIGGLQPFEASVVDQTGYGDCKALSNYMVALLREVGIKGYYTTIMAGESESEVDAQFPSDQANHVIVAVPTKIDTTWLECTSQTNPYGWMGRFTGDRYAMMVTENGGALVRTPTYPLTVNTQSRRATVNLDLNGNATAKVKTVYAGLQYENNRLDAVVTKQADDHKKWIQSNTQIPSFDVGKFSFKNNKDKIPSAEVEVEYILNRLATVNGKRIFLTPNLMNRNAYIPEKLEKRKTDIVLRMPYIDEDVIEYTIPEAIYPEFVPEAVNIKSRFGEYESSFKVDQGKLIYSRKIKMNKGQFPADSYNEFLEFYKSINKADNVKVVFVNKT